jgi:hypothetical protein
MLSEGMRRVALISPALLSQRVRREKDIAEQE